MFKRLAAIIGDNYQESLFAIALFATLASLILSNVLDYVPCELCWYQRMFMFPLPLVYGVGMLKKDRTAYAYGLPLIAVGGLIAAYQTALQWGWIAVDSSQCSLSSVSCAEPTINWFGFLTIPFGSLLSFGALGVVSLIAAKRHPLELDSQSRPARNLLMITVSLALAAALAVIIIRFNQA